MKFLTAGDPGVNVCNKYLNCLLTWNGQWLRVKWRDVITGSTNNDPMDSHGKSFVGCNRYGIHWDKTRLLTMCRLNFPTIQLQGMHWELLKHPSMLKHCQYFFWFWPNDVAVPRLNANFWTLWTSPQFVKLGMIYHWERNCAGTTREACKCLATGYRSPNWLS